MADINSPGLAGFLVRLPAGARTGTGLARGAARSRIRAAGVSFDLEPLFAARAPADAAGIAGAAFEWHVATPSGAPDAATAWQAAHALNEAASAAVAGAPVLVEPDLVQQWPYDNPTARDRDALGAGDACVFNDQRPELPRIDDLFAWHLDPAFSQLRQARTSAAGGTSRVRIAHLDTGYDPAHQTLPSRIRLDLQRNFVDDQGPHDARDPAIRGALRNPGHGTGTLSILAGNHFSFNRHGYAFDDVVGGAPEAEVVPVRVGQSVLQLRTSSIARGITYAADLCADEATRIHVLSMSMGGVASAAWADAVNLAYEAGIVFVAAAGNNFSAGFFGFPTHFIVYPARFRRVIAACGVMANRKPYYGLPFRSMQGNWGPASKMATALSAFTPNMPWAEIGCAGLVDMDGSGTSAATPQVAAAAALYLQKHAATLFDAAKYPDPWMRVEAVRQALFARADKTADGGSTEKLGNGILRAADALALQPPASQSLHKTAPDSAVLPVLRVLTGLGVAPSPAADAMLALEATQLAHCWSRDDRPNPLETALPDPDLAAESMPPAQVRRVLDAVLDHPDASAPLKARAEEARRTLFGTSAPGRPSPRRRRKGAEQGKPEPEPAPLRAPAATPMPFVPTEPAFRYLRGYSIDPSLTTELDLAPIGEITFKIPWEGLAPGPVGEYLEVVDVDPPSGCFYEPVDLDDPKLLAQNGLAPSEGTPQFHQQMVYAVASLTIRNFERALGRRSLWRPGPPPAGTDPKNDSTFVQRLRVYPHALREQNAYYSPKKVGPAVRLLQGHRARGQRITCRAGSSSPASRTTSSRTRPCTRCSTACTGASSAQPTPTCRAFHEALRRHRRAAAALHVPRDPPAPDCLDAGRAAHAPEPARAARGPVRPIDRPARRAARCHRPGEPDDGRVGAAQARSRGVRDGHRAARARRHSRGRGVRCVPVHLRAPHRRPAAPGHRRHRRAAAGRDSPRPGHAPGR